MLDGLTHPRAMRYLSVCSGIEAATQAWHPLGWVPVAFSEIEPFPSAILAHHYPTVPNWGDMTKFEEWPDATVDVLCGGTPCQDYSFAGNRLGMAGSRGQLTLTFVEIAARYRPDWLVWENVFGVLSSNAGRDFARFLGDLTGQIIKVPEGGWGNSGICAGIGDAYGIAYRVFDAQYIRTRGFRRAIPQRRRRVWVVGYIGDWRRAAAVLFDRESLSGHPSPRREAGQGVAKGFECGPQGGSITDVAPTLDTRCKDGPIRNQLGAGVIQSNSGEVAHVIRGHGDYGPGLPCLRAEGGDCVGGSEALLTVANTLRGEGFDASEDGNGRQNLLPVAFDTTQITSAANYSNPKPGDPCHPLAAGAHPPAVAFDMRGIEGGAMPEGPHDTANIRAASGGSSRSYVAHPWAVRRLTPRECERLMGFPDDFSAIPWRGKPADLCPDGPRYKALGNSWPVNCAEWIGERIAIVDAFIQEATA